MLLEASDEHEIDPKHSFVIGDRVMVGMAHAARAKRRLAPEQGTQYHVENEMEDSEERPEYITDKFMNAAEWTLSVLLCSS
jgi:histidinol phosphatase-like enzyme